VAALQLPGLPAYSATPPDFGTLLIQRRRWVNGGLLVLPRLARYAIAGPRHLATPIELPMRLHYLASLFAGSVGLLALLLDAAALAAEVAAWQAERNAAAVVVDWPFTSEDARTTLKQLSPVLEPVKRTCTDC